MRHEWKRVRSQCWHVGNAVDFPGAGCNVDAGSVDIAVRTDNVAGDLQGRTSVAGVYSS